MDRFVAVNAWLPSRTRFVTLTACTTCGCLVGEGLQQTHLRVCPVDLPGRGRDVETGGP